VNVKPLNPDDKVLIKPGRNIVEIPQANDLNILVVGDDPSTRETIQGSMDSIGFSVRTAGNGIEALKHFDKTMFDLVFTELQMPHMGGLELLERLKERYPEVFVVLLTGPDTTELALHITNNGACGYMLRPTDQEKLFTILQRITEHKRFISKSIYPYEERRKTHRFENIIGKTPKMLDLFHKIRDVANSSIPVLLTGESGTGKELVANALHYTGLRKQGPYIKLNCASIPDGLIESEFFGHEKGAFTTAIAQKKGRFELADGGTLFLDEIGEMPFQMQAKLLRVLDDGTFERVGGVKTLHSDVRIICATNKDILQEVKEKRIREDLFYRIYAATIHLPTLRERKDDIPLLANYFAYRYSKRNNTALKGFSKDCYKALLAYDWPGNVRELINVVEQAIVFCKEEDIALECLPEYIRAKPEQEEFSLSLTSSSLPLAEANLIRKVVEDADWNLKRAARELDIARGTLYSKMKKYNIKRPTL